MFIQSNLKTMYGLAALWISIHLFIIPGPSLYKTASILDGTQKASYIFPLFPDTHLL